MGHTVQKFQMSNFDAFFRPSLVKTAFLCCIRFSKQSVRRISDLLTEDLRRPNRRGKPLPPAEQVAVALLQLGGGSFQRVAGLAGGQLSQNCARVRREFITEIYTMLWVRKNTVWVVFIRPDPKHCL